LADPRRDGERFGRVEIGGAVYGGWIRENRIDLCAGDPLRGTKELRVVRHLSESRLLLPLEPRTLWCVGRNYAAHAAELGNEVPAEPLIFMKAPGALLPPEGTIRLPLWAGRIDYEGELAVVVGRKARNVSESEAAGCILGYTILNDVTARDLQREDGQWTRAKGFDTFAPLGPFLRLGTSMPPESRIRTRRNGRVVQEAFLSDMIFSPARLVAHISRFATLQPGDLIATGTPEGVGPLSPGDQVEVEIDGIGVLRNFCLAEEED
jgi:2-keto-4-pentenoate hydratase/2-oxohepta-3-ene-1,7-dioic acid hydratase in catechol pathway